MQQIRVPVCYKNFNKIYTIWDINMKLIHKLLNKMTNRFWKCQGCSLKYMWMANNLDVSVLVLTVGTLLFLHIFALQCGLQFLEFFYPFVFNIAPLTECLLIWKHQASLWDSGQSYLDLMLPSTKKVFLVAAYIVMLRELVDMICRCICVKN